jgi:catechol 2,3-dioxygenase-like lactoylglutathione lyase family enzyme
MKILSGIPVLRCRDIDTTLAFYLDYLRFVTVKRRESDDRLQWVHIMHADTSLMLQRVDSGQAEESVSATIDMYFYVDDIDEFHHFLQSRGYPVTDVYQTPYRIKEFSVKDPEGNTLTLGKVLVAADL